MPLSTLSEMCAKWSSAIDLILKYLASLAVRPLGGRTCLRVKCLKNSDAWGANIFGKYNTVNE
ncbi:hypothetical protein FHR49_001112 [Xanthomonas campestris]